MRMNRINVLMGIGCIAVSVYLYWVTNSFPPPLQPKAPGPTLFPRLCLGAIIVFSLWLMVETILGKGEDREAVGLKTGKFLMEVGMVALYLFLLPRLGFLLAGFLYLCPSLAMRMESRLRAVTLSALVVVTLYLLFDVVLDITLPNFSLFGL